MINKIILIKYIDVRYSKNIKNGFINNQKEKSTMVIGTATVTIYAPWVHSLKEKRMIVKSLCTKIGNKFNVSIAEIEEQDIHQRVVLGMACIAMEASFADSVIDTILNFIESNTEGEIIEIKREFR